jgi:hypothetical protein
MTKLLTIFYDKFHSIMNVVFSLIVFYIILYPYYLPFYFENTLGRASMILFIIVMTFCNPIMGILATFIFIGLYNYRILEGLENMPTTTTSTAPVSTTDVSTTDVPTIVKTPDPASTTASTPGIAPTPVSAPASDNKIVSPALDKTSEPTTVPKNEPVIIPKKKEEDKKEGFNNRLTYAELDEGRNRMLTIENYMRKPKSSNQMPITKYHESNVEPISFAGFEGLTNVSTLK